MFKFLFGKRAKLDKPLTLLNENFVKISDRIYSSKERYYINEDTGAYLEYCSIEDHENADFSHILEVRVRNFVEHYDNPKYGDTIIAAGKIYVDENENFIDSIINEVVGGKVHVRDKKGEIMDDVYWYDNDIAIEIEKYRLDSCGGGYWEVVIRYVNTNPPVQKGYEDKKKKQTTRNKQIKQRIKEDVKNCLK